MNFSKLRKSIIYFLIITLIVSVSLFNIEIKYLQDANVWFKNVEKISSSTQRIIKLEAEMKNVDSLLKENFFEMIHISENNFVFKNKEIEEIVNTIVSSWDKIFNIMTHDNINAEELHTYGELHYYYSNLLLSKIINYIDYLNEIIYLSKNIIVIEMMLICLFIYLEHRYIKKQFKLYKYILNRMDINEETGIYNRNRSLEFLKFNTPENKGEVLVIFELDNKNINIADSDYYSNSKLRDAYMLKFISFLQKATNIYSEKPFIGHYNDNQIIVRYFNTNRHETLFYLGEVKKLVNNFNIDVQNKKRKKRKKNKYDFEMIYNAGYALSANINSEKFDDTNLFNEACKNLNESKKDSNGEVVNLNNKESLDVG